MSYRARDIENFYCNIAKLSLVMHNKYDSKYAPLLSDEFNGGEEVKKKAKIIISNKSKIVCHH